MRERINRLAKGIVDEEMPRLVPDPESIKYAIKADEVVRTEIVIGSSNNTSLKGLAYSTNPRVKVLTPSYGGNKNRVVCEIDSSYLHKGDVIRGCIHLVTNGGEQDVPYELDIEQGSAGKTLGNLKRIEDFTLIAKEDQETALRLFEYKDFKDAPFMSDIMISSLYECFSGRANKQIAMEEFLVACHAKPQVTISVDVQDYDYSGLTENKLVYIPIRRSGWGHIEISVKSTVDFIVPEKRQVTENDFIGDVCDLPCTIDFGKLHSGKNMGELAILTIKDMLPIRIIASADEAVDEDYLKNRYMYHRGFYSSYMKNRLKYECTTDTASKAEIANQMISDLDKLTTWSEKSNMIAVLRAEALICKGDIPAATLCVDAVRDDIKAHRQEQLMEYFLLEYVDTIINPSPSGKESLIRLVKKFLTEEKMFELWPILIKLDPSISQDPSTLLSMYEEAYAQGCRSPYLYKAYIDVITVHTEYLHDIGAKELSALYFGYKYNLIDEELSSVISIRALMVKKYTDTCMNLLVGLYERYPSSAMITAICSILIKGDKRSKNVHIWFVKGVKSGCDITALYRYYLYTLPENYDELLPREAVEYFVTHDSELDTLTKAKLYDNILTYMKPETYIFREYSERIHTLAVEEAKQGHMDKHLARIYEKELDAASIDDSLAKVLPAILSSYYIEVRSSFIKQVLVVYPELKTADMYSITDEGMACVPIYTDEAIVLFQDAYGNRYYGVRFKKKVAIDKPDLIDCCYEIYPEHIMLRVKRLRQILADGIHSLTDAGMVERALSQIPLSDRYRQLALSALIRYYRNSVTEENSSDQAGKAQSAFLLMTDKNSMTQEERTQVCDTLIDMGYFKEAYEMIKQFDCEYISDTNLELLCAKTILDKMFNQEHLLLHLAFTAVSKGSKSKVLVDYLCEHFNSSTDDMLSILDIAIEEGTETYDLEERLLAQMLFTENYRHMDRVFKRYIESRKRGESIVKAYFTVKCARYFLNNEPMQDDLFEYLETSYTNKLESNKLPTIYALTLAKHYAAMPRLDEAHVIIAESIVSGLIEEGLVFPFYKKLSPQVNIPRDIMEKAIIVYRTKSNKKPLLRVRILPGQDEYTEAEMRHMYLNIYIKEQVLFSGETWEFKLYDSEDATSPSKEGRIVGGGRFEDTDSRFAYLDSLSSMLTEDNTDKLVESMKQYIIEDESVKRLFKIK